MKAIQIEVPAMSGVSEFEARIILAGELYERGKLSLGHAAQVTGLSKRAFIEVMGKYGFSIFSSNPDDFKSDLRNAWKPS